MAQAATADVLFEPLRFRNLTVKNRILRSNISGRCDNYDGSGTQARINWEERFARNGVGAIISSYSPIDVRGRILPNYATIDRDERIPLAGQLEGFRGALEARTKELGDRGSVTTPNIASLMLLAEEDGRTALLTGDGHADDILRCLEEASRLDGDGGIHVDVLKGPTPRLRAQHRRRVLPPRERRRLPLLRQRRAREPRSRRGPGDHRVADRDRVGAKQEPGRRGEVQALVQCELGNGA